MRDDDAGQRMVGYIGANELEHALSIVADEPGEAVRFSNTLPYHHANPMASSFSSAGDAGSITGVGIDPFDFSYYMDEVSFGGLGLAWLLMMSFVKAPLTVQSNSPLELVQQFFTKLGARYVVVTDMDGLCSTLR